MKRILVIDDEAECRDLFALFLRSLHYQVDTAENGRIGLTLLEKDEYDLVITDLMMPDMDGLEVVRSIRKISQELPVIAISGGMRSAPFNFLHVAQQLGATLSLFKPVEMADLAGAVQQALGE